MNDKREKILKISKSITFQKKRILFSFACVCVLSFLVFIYVFVVSITSKHVVIKEYFHTKHFKQDNTSSLSRGVRIETFLKKNEKFVIQSEEAETKTDGKNILQKCHIITNHIRKKIYEGDTEIITTDGKTNTFNVPKEMLLKNGKSNFIHTQTLDGTFDGDFSSDLPVAINDDDLFLSGDNILGKNNENYLLITKNAHVVQTQEAKKYDIRSEKMEVFGNKQYAEFTDKVVFTADGDVVKSNFAKVYLNEKYEVKDIFLRGKVDITNKDTNAKADFGYFDIDANLIVLYNNVVLTSKTAKSQNEFYIYNTQEKTGMSFGENVILPKAEADKVYNLLEKLIIELPQKHQKYIKNVIKNNKKNRRNKNLSSSDNSNIDRTKRAKIKLLNS